MKLFSGLLSNICKILRRFEKLRFVIMLSHKHNHHLFHHCCCLNFEMWFKSESRGRSHGEHKSNSEGGDSKYEDHVPENRNYCVNMMVVRKLMITKMWIDRDKLTEIFAKEGGGSFSNKHLHRLHHRHLPHHQVAIRNDVNNGDDNGRYWFDDGDDDVYIDGDDNDGANEVISNHSG